MGIYRLKPRRLQGLSAGPGLYMGRAAPQPEGKLPRQKEEKRKKGPEPAGSFRSVLRQEEPAGRKKPAERLQKGQENGYIQENRTQNEGSGKYGGKKGDAGRREKCRGQGFYSGKGRQIPQEAVPYIEGNGAGEQDMHKTEGTSCGKERQKQLQKLQRQGKLCLLYTSRCV